LFSFHGSDNYTVLWSIGCGCVRWLTPGRTSSDTCSSRTWDYVFALNLMNDC
jgi:hypothetical protein